MLEDEISDVIRKALVGCGLSEDELLAQLKISSSAWQAWLAGNPDLALTRRVADVLQLAAEPLARYGLYHPAALNVAGIRQLELPFGQWTVNAWWVEWGDAKLVFDAGTGAMDLIEALPAKPQTALITHGHHDHVGALEALRARDVPILTHESLKPGQALTFGSLRLRTCDLSGHYCPALGYHIEGLDRPALVVGDALFAGSMGKTSGPERYQLALKTLRAAIDGLPDETVLLPGHGPATTVREEKQGNPFLGYR